MFASGPVLVWRYMLLSPPLAGAQVEELRGLKDDVRTLQERNEYHVTMLQDEHT